MSDRPEDKGGRNALQTVQDAALFIKDNPGATVACLVLVVNGAPHFMWSDGNRLVMIGACADLLAYMTNVVGKSPPVTDPFPTAEVKTGGTLN